MPDGRIRKYINSLQKFILILHDCLHSDFISLRIQGTSLISERSQFDCIGFPIVQKSPVPICEDSNRLEDDAECFSVCTDGLCTSGLRPALCRLLRQVFLKDSQSSRCISCMVNMNGMVQLPRCAGLNPTVFDLIRQNPYKSDSALQNRSSSPGRLALH